jgi:hypothetical protein
MMRKLVFILVAGVLFLPFSSVSQALDTTKGITPPTKLTPTPYPPGPPKVRAEAAGVIKKQGTTAYMYGTHVLVGAKTYALKSDTIDLNKYIGKKVTVSGELLSGYPLSGGPEFMNVDRIR